MTKIIVSFFVGSQCSADDSAKASAPKTWSSVASVRYGTPSSSSNKEKGEHLQFQYFCSRSKKWRVQIFRGIPTNLLACYIGGFPKMVVYPTTMGKTPHIAYIAGHLSHPSHPSWPLPANPLPSEISDLLRSDSQAEKKSQAEEPMGNFEVPSSGFIDSAWIFLGDFP